MIWVFWRPLALHVRWRNLISVLPYWIMPRSIRSLVWRIKASRSSLGSRPTVLRAAISSFYEEGIAHRCTWPTRQALIGPSWVASSLSSFGVAWPSPLSQTNEILKVHKNDLEYHVPGHHFYSSS